MLDIKELTMSKMKYTTEATIYKFFKNNGE
jgi:hypothetical protein